jgi:hypothetical protein
MPTGGTSLDADFDSVIDGLDEVLLGAEVAFGGLDGGVPQGGFHSTESQSLSKIPPGFRSQMQSH